MTTLLTTLMVGAVLQAAPAPPAPPPRPARLAVAGALAMPRVHMRMPRIRAPRLAMIRARAERPGPDSAQVVALLSHLAAADVAVCELAVDMLGNGWNWGSRWGELSALRDARTPAMRPLISKRPSSSVRSQ